MRLATRSLQASAVVAADQGQRAFRDAPAAPGVASGATTFIDGLHDDLNPDEFNGRATDQGAIQ